MSIDPGAKITLAELPLRPELVGEQPYGAPQLVAMGHPAADGIGATEHQLHLRHAARFEGLTHQGAADPLAGKLETLGADHLEPEAPTGLLQQVEVPFPPLAEAKIVADHQIVHAEFLHQQLLDEGAGRLLGKTMGETHAEHAIDLHSLEGFVLLPPAAEAGGRGTARKQLQRLGFEQHDAGRQAKLGGLLLQTGQHCVVPLMNPIEVAYGQYTAPVTGLDIVNAANKLHQCLVRCCHGNRRIIYQAAGRVSPAVDPI